MYIEKQLVNYFLPTEDSTLESPRFNNYGEIDIFINNISYVGHRLVNNAPTIHIEPAEIRGADEAITELAQTMLENSQEELAGHMNTLRGGKYMSYSPGNTPKINENRKKKKKLSHGKHILVPSNEKTHT